MEKDKPCPFCGHPENVSLDRSGTRLAYVECLGCSAHGPAKDHEPGAIAAWNTRSIPNGEGVEAMIEKAASIISAGRLAHKQSVEIANEVVAAQLSTLLKRVELAKGALEKIASRPGETGCYQIASEALVSLNVQSSDKD